MRPVTDQRDLHRPSMHPLCSLGLSRLNIIYRDGCLLRQIWLKNDGYAYRHQPMPLLASKTTGRRNAHSNVTALGRGDWMELSDGVAGPPAACHPDSPGATA